MAWDRCNQDAVWRELECAALVGEDQPLCPDLPELDLSELDVSDLDADSFLGGLKWYSDQSEIISSQYGNESSNLFEKIDEENEANLLAVLTETLDSIPVDEDGLPSFEALADGDVTNASDQSCPSTPDGSPRTPEPEEPSLLKKLLLAPPNSQLSYNQYPGGKAQNHAASNHRIRPTPAVTKTENPWNSKQRGVCPQPNRLVRRPCTELLKYLTASDDAFQTRANEAKSTWSGCGKDRGGPGTSSCSSSSSPSSSSTSSFSSLSSCSSSTASKKKTSSASLSSQQQQQQQQLAAQAQRGESQTAGACSVAGEGAGQWRPRTHGEHSAPIVPSRGSGCGHAWSGEEGRPPGLQPSADTGSLAAARFIRYMHSYSLPPRETGRAGSCGRCLEAGGWAGASRAERHIRLTIRKRRQEQEHPMLSKLLTSRPRPARYRAHLQMPSVPQTSGRQSPPAMTPKDKGWDWHIGKDREELQNNKPVPDLLDPYKADPPEPGLELSRLVDLDLESWLQKLEQETEGSKDKEGQNGVDVHDDDILGGPVSFPWVSPRPLFPDALVPEHTPSATQGQNPHKQALCKPPDDQVPPPLAKPTTLPLPLTPESPNDHKGSPFENKTIERTLSVEISGTPGLTPPTTPPHKASQENPFKVSLKTKLSSCSSSALTSKRAKLSNGGPFPQPSSGSSRKGPEQTELYAQLSKASSALPLGGSEECRGKRPTPRVFGDHDYCQSASTKRDGSSTATALTGPLEGRHVECKDSAMPSSSVPTSTSSSASPSSSSLARQLQGLPPTVQEACPDKEVHSPTLDAKTSAESNSAGRKLLRDQEIRDELNKHFGKPQEAFYNEADQKGSQPLEESDSGDENYNPFGDYAHTALPDFEDLEVCRERLLCSWEGTPLELLFERSPSCSPSNSSPSRSSVSPPSTMLSPLHFRWPQYGSRSRSRSRSSSHHRRRSLSRSPYSRSQSPASRSPSWSRHTVDNSTFKSRTRRSPQSQSHSTLGRRPRYNSYEEYQHEQLRREEYQRDYEKREGERAEQRERQRKKAIEERRVLYVGRLRADSTRSELKRRFEVFGEIEECAINLRHDGDNFGFITYRYTCDAFAALENGHTLRRSNEPQFELCFGGQKQFFKSNYTDLDSHSDDFDPASTKSKYDSMDFDSLLREAQCSLRR
ncbi:peroxisome proliferator-activated receptor gamma coactivator 1-alpha isoform X1 [Astyanax mexicanus]|uniref:peroxisome proliferator-activated receptor gamma coactivator 1-alpha isoform X1 n=1 Tax=Astyanax mexicanus TaxID=7994 RepID=UPI0020CAF350|nr:peroxisome proliferator-activated receptor gamma coactivator 1-alpha isoform X1 [Astyanax mexicanus]